MGYLFLIVMLASLFAGGYGTYQWEEGKYARLEKEKQDVEQKLRDKDDALITEAANNIANMEGAYEAGLANRKGVTRGIVQKGTALASSDKGISNPVCVAADDSLHFLISARAGMFPTTDTGGAATGVPATGPASGRNIQGNLPDGAAGHGTVGGVHPDARPAGNGGAVSGNSVSAHPKPKPVGK